MRPNEIIKLEAGRELDALVAEKVMGLKLLDGNEYFRLNGAGAVLRVYRYSTDIAAAWDVVKKFPNGRFILELGARQASVEFQGYLNEKVRVDGIPEDVAPLAICRAALLAVMEKQ